MGLVGFKGINIALEVIFAKNGVNGSETEFAFGNHLAQMPETVHRTGRSLYYKVEWYGQLKALEVCAHFLHVLIDDDADALGVAPEHDVDQATNHGLALEFHKWLGFGYPFLGQSRTFACCYYRVVHSLYIIMYKSV